MSMLDVVAYGAFVVMLVITSFVLFFTTAQVNVACDSFVASVGNNSNLTGMCSQPYRAAINFGNTVPLVLGAVGLGIIVLAAFIPTSPLFMIAGIILFLVAVVVAVNVQAVIPSVLAQPVFQGAASYFGLSTQLLSNVAWLVLFVGAGVFVVLFSRIRGGGGGNRYTPEG